MEQIVLSRIDNTHSPLAKQKASIPTAASELQSLLAVPALAGVPLLVVRTRPSITSYPLR